MTRIAIIVTHLRQAEHLAACLDSLTAQTRVPDEIIVVDASPGDTSGVIRDHGERVTRLVAPRAGIAAARNAGLHATTCDLVAFLDADHVAATDRIEWQLDVFASHPDIVLSHGAMVPMDRRGPGHRGVLPSMAQHVPVDQQLGRLVARNHIATDTVCARRDIVMALGGFCEMPGVREDYDLWLRMATEGRFHYIDAPLTVSRRHDSPRGDEAASIFEGEAGALNRLEWPAIADALRRAYPGDAERAIIEGEVRLRRGEFRLAELHFLALARRPHAAAALFHLAHFAMRRGSLDFAEAALRRALHEEPQDAAAWNNLGVVLIRSGRPDEAADAFARAVDLRPYDQDAAHNLDLMLHPLEMRAEPFERRRGPSWSAWKITRWRPQPYVMPLAAAA